MPHVIEYDQATKRIEVSQTCGVVIIAAGPKPYSMHRAKHLLEITPSQARELADALREIADYAESDETERQLQAGLDTLTNR